MNEHRDSTPLSVDRREMLVAAAVGLVASIIPIVKAPTSDRIEAAIGELIGSATPRDGGIVLQVPETAENGAAVPVTVLVDSPMTAERHVRAIHLIATRNPTPGIASFRLTPASGKAQVSMRIRLAERQTLLVFAEHSDGTVDRAAAEIKVSVGGFLT
ncbi:thiosulfate oxidation carrier protein SoxY [Rhodopseudomonas sp. HC1]|uniref:thiosulfate oxidation carrier protein SoxY n=1 Tax=Rhodopseudomonas infernalis TaxID=2897386 RepID=UPI001EE81AB4|nr:thiosulfate oxidation carrier protein SoxY [Rhodopseudomonas infernalis]MCG6203450.1 thiosulfate oxidation carrier protein SoxY [Rhodopseudomonas infernalis]